MRFVDQVQIIVAAGSGGAGCISFHRAKYMPRGGPDGGNGGNGGALIFLATARRNTLADFRRNRTYRARNGGQGLGKNMYGARGDDLTLLVPIGTMVYDLDTDELICDLVEEGDTFRLEGGKGGLGNNAFKSASNRTPRLAQPGEPIDEIKIRMELKLVADVGLLGFPNAGKSTFIRAVTGSKSEIGAHPFTTLTPHLGVVNLSEGRNFVLADMPGLIEGAADGQGLGHEFLRHVERCKIYLHLLAPDAWEGPPIERFAKLNGELQKYAQDLADRPQIVVLSKADLIPKDELDELVEAIKVASKSKVFVVSSLTGEGVEELMTATFQAVTVFRKAAAKAAAAAKAVVAAEKAAKTAKAAAKAEKSAAKAVESNPENPAAGAPESPIQDA